MSLAHDLLCLSPLSFSASVPDELNEDDLMDELNALEDEIAQEESEELPGRTRCGMHTARVSGYLQHSFSRALNCCSAPPLSSSTQRICSTPPVHPRVQRL